VGIRIVGSRFGDSFIFAALVWCYTINMFRAFKTLLLWLIMAALPLQGVASTIKSSCGPQHHGLPEVATMSSHHHGHGVDNGQYDGSPMHISAGAAAADNPANLDTPPTAKSSYCSACAACCIGAVAPPSASLWSPATSGPEVITLSPESWVAGVIPSGLERPPKRISA
jgi:hypothetical protein